MAPLIRTITGSATGSGADGVAVPVVITLTPGLGLDTVTATNGATISNINSLMGTCLVTPNGANTVVSHTTKTISTFTSLQKVGETNYGAVGLTTTGVNITLPVVPLEGDLLEVWENYNNNTTQDHIIWVRVSANRTSQSFQFPAEGNALLTVFPATLTAVVQMRGATNQFIRRIRVWRDAANGFAVPTASVVREPVNVTINGGANNLLFTGTSARILAAPPAGQILTTVTAPGGLSVSISDPRTGALEVFAPAGTVGPLNITATFATPGTARIIAAANAGVAVTMGSLRFQMAASGNRSMQIASATGAAISISLQNTRDAIGAGTGVVNLSLLANGTFAYVNGGWNFNNAGEWQEVRINDTTNNRHYNLRMEVGSGWNNNAFAGFEVL
jgi:hypothetical protein